MKRMIYLGGREKRYAPVNKILALDGFSSKLLMEQPCPSQMSAHSRTRTATDFVPINLIARLTGISS
jgi:hypothetical protein